MLLEVEGFILTETPYGETSKIINVFTKQYGVIGIMCKGAKSLKNKNRVSTMRLTYARFNIYYKEKKLSNLVSSDIINPLKKIKSDIVLVSYLNYLTELTNQVVKQSNSNIVYDIFINTILKIEDGLDPLVLTNVLELKYLDYLGVMFNLDECALCGNKKNIATLNSDKGGFICIDCLTNEVVISNKVIKMLRMYYYVNIAGISNINVDAGTKKTINEFLNNYYERYTGLYLNTKEFLKKLL